MILYQEKYFNKRNWILENISKLNLSPQETLILLQIDFANEFKETITSQLLSSRCNMEILEVDKVLKQLVDKGLLSMKAQKLKVIFDISAIFTVNNLSDSQNVFDVFEKEFNKVLSQKETEHICEWLRMYDEDTVIDALREASIANKLKFSYIEKILANNDEK